MAWQAKINLGLADCLDTDDTNQGETAAPIIMDLPNGPWVQFIYEGITDQDGNYIDVRFGPDGFWHHKDLRWSDLNIEITEVASP